MNESESPEASVVRVFFDDAHEVRWSAISSNGNVVATSGEGYKNHGDALGAARSLFPDAEIRDETKAV